jgi:hypothetical protein
MENIANLTKLAGHNGEPFDESDRLKYCQDLFELESTTRDQIEKKAQFLFALVSLLLGGILFNIDFFPDISSEIQSRFPEFSTALLVAYVTTVGLTFFSLLFIVAALRIQTYLKPYPDDLAEKLFYGDEASAYTSSAQEFRRKVAVSYAVALLDNREVNRRKAQYVKYAVQSLAVASTGAFLIVTVYAAFVSLH